MGFLSKLQQKPPYVRTAIMWSAVFICMSVIVGVWAWSFDRSVELAKKEQEQPQIKNPFEELKEEVPSLWQSLGAGIKNLFGDLSGEIPQAEEVGLEPTFEQELESEELESDEAQPSQLPEVE